MARIVLLVVLLQSSVVGAQMSCAGQLSPTEVVICASPELLELDRILGVAYRSANGASPDPKALRSEQRNWLRKRNLCDRYDCLKPLYDSRIAELRGFQEEVRARAGAQIDSSNAMQVCTAIARRVDTDSLDELVPFSVPGRRLASDERKGMETLIGWPVLHERARVYEVPLKKDEPPTRIANFWGHHDCRSARMLNLDRYLASEGHDLGRDPDGVLGLNTEVALSTAHDKLIELDSRYFVFTGAPPVPRATPVGEYLKKEPTMSGLEGSVSVLSLIRPDGVIQPLCELKTETTEMVPRQGAPDPICIARARGTLPLAQWFQSAAGFGDISNPFDGMNPIAVHVARAGLDQVRTPYFLVRLAFDPGLECGSVRAWSTTLREEPGAVAQTDLLDLVQPTYTGKATWPELYQADGRTFVEVGRNRELFELFEIENGRLRQVCEFVRRSTTRVGQVFDSAGSGTSK